MKTLQNKGITLIALVVTIVVLLILAGISITALFGDNGLITRAQGLQNTVNSAQQSELEEIEGLVDNIYISTLKTETTKPYLPSSSFYIPNNIEGAENTLAKGLVIKDTSGNEYVWIEVPKDIYNNASYNTKQTTADMKPENETEYEKIRYCLQKYTSSYRKSGYEDYWYYRTTIKDETNKDIYVTYSKDPLTGNKYENINNVIQSSTANLDETKTDGCGLNYAEYTTLYKAMLKSVYLNGGFYIGRYEAGTETARNSGGNIENITPISKQDKYPLNHISCSQAQTIASKVNSGSYNSSLMFGVQWDLVLKYLESKGTSQADLKTNSTSWGNYRNAEITLTRGKYAILNANDSFTGEWKAYNVNTENYVVNGVKQKNTSKTNNWGVATDQYGKVLLTTGASNTLKKQNIYDLAGNTWEWTLERTSYSPSSCALRGGSCYGDGSDYPASYRNYYDPDNYHYRIGFRVALY